MVWDEGRFEVMRHLYEERRKRGEKDEPAVWSGIAFAIAGVGVLVFGPGLLSLLVDLVHTGASLIWVRVGVAAAAVFLLGWLFFHLRKIRPTYYGYVEIGVGIGVGIQAVFTERAFDPDARMATGFAVLGAVYLVVRGFDNATKRKAELAAEAKLREELLEIVNEAMKS